MSDAINLAWSVGFFEGEGTVRVNKCTRGSPPTFGLQVVNTDLESLMKFQSGVFGLGRINGPYGPYGKGKKQTYVWTCNKSKEAKLIAEAMRGMLSAKRQKQIDDAQTLTEVPRVGRWPKKADDLAI